MSAPQGQSRRRDQDDGVISIVIALSMVVFVGILAIVVDLGQIYVARAQLVNATDAAVSVAAEHLATGGCGEYDEALLLATDLLQDTAPTATMSSFEVQYGATTVTNEAQCGALAGDERVGRLNIVAADTRTLIFGSAFTSKDGDTQTAASAEWGYVSGVTGGIFPFSLCSDLDPYQEYLDYLRQQARHEILGLPLVAPDPAAYLTPFDLEIDDFDTNQIIVDPLLVGPDENITPGVCNAGAGRMSALNLSSAGSLSSAEMDDQVEHGAPYIISFDPTTLAADCGDGVDNQAGDCRGVGSTESPDDITPFIPLVGRTMTLLVHDPSSAPNGVQCDVTLPTCLNTDGAGHGRSGDADRRARRYPLVNVVRVKVLCVRDINGAPGSPTTAYGTAADCAGLNWTWTSDLNPNEPMIRLQFVVDEVVREGQLTDEPTYYGDPTLLDLLPDLLDPFGLVPPTYTNGFFTGFLGMHICAVDGSDNCVL